MFKSFKISILKRMLKKSFILIILMKIVVRHKHWTILFYFYNFILVDQIADTRHNKILLCIVKNYAVPARKYATKSTDK